MSEEKAEEKKSDGPKKFRLDFPALTKEDGSFTDLNGNPLDKAAYDKAVESLNELTEIEKKWILIEFSRLTYVFDNMSYDAKTTLDKSLDYISQEASKPKIEIVKA